MSKSKNIKGKVQISTYDDILQSSQGEQTRQSIDETLPKANGNEVVNIPIDQLHEFKNHPFRVEDDEKMQELVESISSKGVVTPIVVRVREDGGFEIISGHRRKRACELAGVTELPAVVKVLDDNEATLLMVDSNIQRENVLPSERAKAFKMRMEAEKKQPGRKKKNADQVGPNLTTKEIGESSGISGTQVKRFIRLTFLLPELIKMVDDGRIPFTVAVDLSFFADKEQRCIYNVIAKTGKSISTKQMKDLQEVSRFGDMTENVAWRIINGSPSIKRTVSFSDKELKQYFSDDLDSCHIKNLILEMLEQYRAGGDGNAE